MRTAVVWLLTAIACVLVVFATLAVGVQQVLLNTDRWVGVVGPLASDHGVQTSVANTAAALTTSALDVSGRTQSLPGPVQKLAASAGTSIASFVDDQALRLVQSPQFANAWVEVNRAAHQALLQVLRGETSANSTVAVANGQVQLNLRQLMPGVMQPLTETLGTQLPADFGYVPIAPAGELATAQQVVQFLDRTTPVLVLAALAGVVVTLGVSHERRRTSFWLGAGVALGMVLAGGVLLVAQAQLMSSMNDRPIGGALQVALSAVLMSLAQFMLVVFIAAAVVAVVAFMAGGRPQRALS
jgi:hypothetical protein